MRPFELHHEPRHLLPTAKERPSTPNPVSRKEPESLRHYLPNQVNLYDELSDHPRVVRVVALSGGYSTEQACDLLSQNGKMIASFSRALTEGLSKQQSDTAFNAVLGSNIDKIFKASV